MEQPQTTAEASRVATPSGADPARDAAGGTRTFNHRRVLIAVEHRAASLTAVRALHSKGYDVWVATSNARTYAALSRARAGTIIVPDPSLDAERFVGALINAAGALAADVVVPAGEPASFALAGRADAFPPQTAVGAVDPAVVQRATDKVALLDLAAAAGLEVPPSILVDRAQFEQCRREISFPALLKPRQSETRVDGGKLEYVMARRVHSLDELRTELERAPGQEWIVQRYIPGRLGAVCGVAWEGRLVCALHQVALRTYPSDGPSAYAVTVSPDVQLEQGVARLLELMDWSGIFQAQFIHADTHQYLIDFNPRTYGSLALAVAAGMNLPATWVELLLGGRPAAHSYRVGVRYRSEERDARAMLTALARGHLARALEVLIPRRRTAHAVFSLRDPYPIVTSIGKLVAIAWRRGRHQTLGIDR
jgi:predicted ATP-grasp superfamily ATP-dependent carboligase